MEQYFTQSYLSILTCAKQEKKFGIFVRRVIENMIPVSYFGVNYSKK